VGAVLEGLVAADPIGGEHFTRGRVPELNLSPIADTGLPDDADQFVRLVLRCPVDRLLGATGEFAEMIETCSAVRGSGLVCERIAEPWTAQLQVAGQDVAV